MIIGVPKEIKTLENRVSLTPAGVSQLTKFEHKVIIEKSAGVGSGITDEMYKKEGAIIVNSADAVYNDTNMIIKVKEPQLAELEKIHEGQIIFTYLHLAPNKLLTEGLIEKKAIAISYETIEKDGKLPLLEPMSEIAGKIGSLMASYHLAKPYGGKGTLPGGVAGVHSARYLIIGGGTAGINAAKIASGLGARVTIMDTNIDRLRYLEDVLPSNCEMIFSDKTNLETELSNCDAIVCTVLIAGASTPKLITRNMLKNIQDGSVLVDISIDQGGCAETSKPTTHADPVYTVDGILHYCVANMPGAYPKTSTYALTNATIPYVIKLANLDWKEAIRKDYALSMGLNIAYGKITYEAVAKAHNMEYTPVSMIL